MNREKRTINRLTTRRLRELTRKKKLDALRKGNAEAAEVRAQIRPIPSSS